MICPLRGQPLPIEFAGAAYHITSRGNQKIRGGGAKIQLHPVGGCRSSGYAFDFCKQGHAEKEGDANKIDPKALKDFSQFAL